MDQANNAVDDNNQSDKYDCKSDKGLELYPKEEIPPAEPFPCDVETSTIELKQHLPPDHPLLERFQQTLKEHLLRVKNQLTEDVNDIKHKIKLKVDEREEFGVKLYDLQQEIAKQNKMLDDYCQNIQSTVEKRVEEEHQCKRLRQEYDDNLAKTNERKLRYNQHVVELSHLQDLENNIRKWAGEFEDRLIASKRVVSKDAQLQKLNAEEQSKSELLMLNLQNEVMKREEELNGLKDQIGVQSHINYVLHTSLADANADLETLQQEHKRLTQAWGEVIVAIQHRDRVLFQARDSLEKQQESLKLTYASIESTKKLLAKETDQNIKLQSFMKRLEDDLTAVKRDSGKKEDILAKLDQKLEELPRILDQTEKDYQEAMRENKQIADQITSIQYKLDRQNVIKGDIEEAILKLAQDQLMCDTASEYRIKVLMDNQEKRRLMTLNLEKVEEQMSNLLQKIERQKLILRHKNDQKNDLCDTLKALDDEANALSQKTRNAEHQNGIAFKRIDKLSKDLAILLKEAQGYEISPTELKIKKVENTILDTDQKVQDHQQFWLMLQNHFVRLHEKRNLQVSELQVMAKQLLIVNQKSLKTDVDIEESMKLTQTIDREIKNWATKLELLSAKCFEKHKLHEINEFDCSTEHAELIDKLKVNEMRVLDLEQETIELKDEIENYKTQVIELHREALSWETKYKLLDDIIRWRHKESAIDSEIGNMRAHIHHLQNRYKELRRIQENLVKDLNNSVMHRETIFVTATRRQKMDKLYFQSRTNIQQRVNEMKMSTKRILCEIKTAEINLKELILQYDELDMIKGKMTKQMEEEIEQNKQVIKEIQQSILLKHQNLDKIVQKQNRAKEYRRFNSMTSFKSLSAKSDTSIGLNIKRQTEINHHLMEVAEVLLNDFPEKSFSIKRIMQALGD